MARLARVEVFVAEWDHIVRRPLRAATGLGRKPESAGNRLARTAERTSLIWTRVAERRLLRSSVAPPTEILMTSDPQFLIETVSSQG